MTTPRTVFSLWVGDIVLEGSQDWIVEGVAVLEGGERPVRLARLSDGGRERWLASDGLELVLFEPAGAVPVPLPPPDPLVVGEIRLSLTSRGGGAVVCHGDCGLRSAERCRYWRYRGEGPVRAWIDDFPGAGWLVGIAIAEEAIELLPRA